MGSLAIDDSLPLLEKIQKYIGSDIMLHRLYLVRSLSDASRQLGLEQSKQHLVPIMETLLIEIEPALRQALVEQIPDFSRHYVESQDESAYTQILHILVPMVAELTTDTVQQVRSSSAESLIQLAKIIRAVDLEPYILPIIKSLANDSTEEEHRLEAVSLLANIAPNLGLELCRRFVLPVITKLSDDPSFRVRKAIAGSIGEVCKTVGHALTISVLLPLFINLSHDEIWGVRKACAESLVSVGSAIPSNERYEKLIPIFDQFVEDPSRWVKGSAFQSLGPFIAIFESKQVSPELLRYYTDMALEPAKMKHMGDEATLFCAFNFPGVLHTIGPNRWNELKDTYIALVKDHQWKVRKTLSHSLHEIAHILGPQQTEIILLPIFDLFLKDLDEVKVGVLENISNFLGVLTPTSRERYLPLLVDLKSTKNWRFRKILSKQLGALSGLFNKANTEECIVTLVLHLCLDVVADVRKAASKGVGILLNRLIVEDSSMRQEFQRQIVSMATHPSCFRRQLFLVICNSLVYQLDNSFFETTFLPKILALQNDHVANVRIGLSQLLQRLSTTQWSKHADVINTIQALNMDKDRDVKFFSSTKNSLPKKSLFTADETGKVIQFIPPQPKDTKEDGKLEENSMKTPDSDLPQVQPETDHLQSSDISGTSTPSHEHEIQQEEEKKDQGEDVGNGEDHDDGDQIKLDASETSSSDEMTSS